MTCPNKTSAGPSPRRGLRIGALKQRLRGEDPGCQICVLSIQYLISVQLSRRGLEARRRSPREVPSAVRSVRSEVGEGEAGRPASAQVGAHTGYRMPFDRGFWHHRASACGDELHFHFHYSFSNLITTFAKMNITTLFNTLHGAQKGLVSRASRTPSPHGGFSGEPTAEELLPLLVLPSGVP